MSREHDGPDGFAGKFPDVSGRLRPWAALRIGLPHYNAAAHGWRWLEAHVQAQTKTADMPDPH